jgi:flagellar assembly protein FliH
MSLRARRISGPISTDRFQWQASKKAAPVPLRPAPLAFAASRGEAIAMADSVDIQARELELPSLSAEHVQAIEREAFAKGYADGERAAQAEAAHQLEITTRQLSSTIDEIAALRLGVMRRAERELIHLALAMAQRIVRRELSLDPDLVLVIARVAVDSLGERATAVVRLNPVDHAVLSAGALEANGTLELVADPDVPRGGCRIQSAFGEIDAGIDAQIRELSRELLGGVDDDQAGDEKVDGISLNS